MIDDKRSMVTGAEQCSEEDMFMVARAATRVASAHAIGFAALRAVDVTVARIGVSTSCVVIVAHDGSWSATAFFATGAMALTFRFRGAAS